MAYLSMADQGMDLSRVLTGSVFNGVVTGGAFYLLESRLTGYSTWQKAGLAAAAGTLALAGTAMILSGVGGRS